MSYDRESHRSSLFTFSLVTFMGVILDAFPVAVVRHPFCFLSSFPLWAAPYSLGPCFLLGSSPLPCCPGSLGLETQRQRQRHQQHGPRNTGTHQAGFSTPCLGPGWEVLVGNLLLVLVFLGAIFHLGVPLLFGSCLLDQMLLLQVISVRFKSKKEASNKLERTIHRRLRKS